MQIDMTRLRQERAKYKHGPRRRVAPSISRPRTGRGRGRRLQTVWDRKMICNSKSAAAAFVLSDLSRGFLAGRGRPQTRARRWSFLQKDRLSVQKRKEKWGKWSPKETVAWHHHGPQPPQNPSGFERFALLRVHAIILERRSQYGGRSSVGRSIAKSQRTNLQYDTRGAIWLACSLPLLSVSSCEVGAVSWFCVGIGWFDLKEEN